jgi:ABC-type phosphate transport system substrate-binding protein
MRRGARYLAAAYLALATSAGVTRAAPDEVVVVVNKANPTASINRDELRPIFQTTKTQWPGGKRIAPFNLPEDDAVRQQFDAAVLRLDPERVARYWVDRKIRGGERPPVKLQSPGAVLRAVAANEGGIGYVKSSEASPSVRIIARVRGGEVVAP